MGDWLEADPLGEDAVVGLEGKRAHTKREPQKGAYHKEKRASPQGPNEVALYAYLETKGRISTAQAAQILNGELKVEVFRNRHQYTLALWWNREQIISLRGERS